MKRHKLLLLCISQAFQLNAQNSGTRVTGNVYANNQLGDYVHVYLLENSDTIHHFKTNTTGSFNFNPQFCAENDYKLVICNYCYSYDVPLTITGYATMMTQEFIFDSIAMMKCCILRSPMGNVYGVNASVPKEQIDLQRIKIIMDEYPGMRITFFQCASPNDRKRIVKKRMLAFQQSVIRAGIDSSRVSFPNHPEIPDSHISDTTLFTEPHIGGVIVFL